MKYAATFIALVSTLASAAAQDPAFDGRIELLAPKRADWEITFRPTAAMRIQQREESRVASVEDLPMTPVDGDESLKRLKVEKSGPLFHETSYFANGKKTEKWGIGAVQFRELKGGSLLAMAGMNLLDPDFSDRSKEDFEELGWLTKDSYKGVITYNGTRCLLFQLSSKKKPLTRREVALKTFMSDTTDSTDSLPAAAAEDPESMVTVIISATTRLPVLYNDGQVVRTYSFETSGLSELIPPPKFEREFAAWRAHVKERNRVPSPP